jgi:hypothetical protein
MSRLWDFEMGLALFVGVWGMVGGEAFRFLRRQSHYVGILEYFMVRAASL